MFCDPKKRRTLSAVLLAGAIAGSTVLGAQLGNSGSPQVTLGWSSNPDPTVAGYYLYTGTTPGNYTNKVDAGSNTTMTVTSLVPGMTYYFSATSYTATGMESSFGPQISYVVPGVVSLTQNPTAGLMRVQFPVAPAKAYQLQCSPDLITWSNLWLTVTQTTNQWLEFDDAYSNTVPAKFYRVIAN
jgi:hypothetical protein